MAVTAVPRAPLAFKIRTGVGILYPFGLPQGVNGVFNTSPYTYPTTFAAHVGTWLIDTVFTSGFDHIRLMVDIGPIIECNNLGQTARKATLLGEIAAAVDQIIFTSGLKCYISLALISGVTGYSLATYLDGTTNYAKLKLAMQDVATKFANYKPDTFAIELLHEPPATSLFTGNYNTMLADMHAAIRAILPQHTLIAEASNWDHPDDLVLLNPSAFDKNTIWAFHHYPLSSIQGGTGSDFTKWFDSVDWEKRPDERPMVLAKVTTRVNADGTIVDKAGKIASVMATFDDMVTKGRDYIEAQCTSVKNWATTNNVSVMCTEYSVVGDNNIFLGMPEQSRINNVRDINVTFAKFNFPRTFKGTDATDFHVPGNPAGVLTLDPFNPPWQQAMMPVAGWAYTQPQVTIPPPPPLPPPPPPPPPPATTVNVPDANTLFSLLNAGVASAGGKLYLLASNTNFGSFFVPAVDFRSNPIWIKGQTGTVFVVLGGTMQGITFENIKATGQPSDATCFQVGTGCDMVTFVNCVADSGAPNGSPSGQGYSIRNCSNITVIGQKNAAIADINNVANAIALIGPCTGITLQNLTINNNGVDGIICADQTSVTIDGILGTNFHSSIAGGDHPDFIQFFGTNNNVTIRNCGWIRGIGNESQGYFMAGVNNLTCQNNWLYGGMLDAISLAGGNTALIDNNYLVGFADYGSRIIVRGAYANATVTNNSAGSVDNYAGDGVNPNFIPAVLPGSNTLIGTVNPGDYTGLDAWLNAHPTARRRP